MTPSKGTTGKGPRVSVRVLEQVKDRAKKWGELKSGFHFSPNETRNDDY